MRSPSSGPRCCNGRRLRRATAIILFFVAGGKRGNPGKVILGTTHIIISATVAKDGDASAAKLEDEKSQWHDGWEGEESQPFPSSFFYFFIDGPTKTGKNEAHRSDEPICIVCIGTHIQKSKCERRRNVTTHAYCTRLLCVYACFVSAVLCAK